MAVNNMDDAGQKTTDMDTIDVAHYFKIVKRHTLRIVFLAITFTVLVALLVFRMTPIYSSSATILVEKQPSDKKQ